MTGLFRALHPSFESLSAFADLSDMEGARTRTGEHVGGCASCRETVAELRAMGDAVRSENVPGPTEGLWARIEVAARSAAEAPVAVAGASRKHSPRGTGRWTLGVALAASLLAAVALMWPSDRSLNASGLSRLTFSPSRPLPGGTLTLRYRPPAWFKGQPRLVLVGDWLTDKPDLDLASRALGDSIGTLRPAPDGSYEARVTLPADFMGVQLAVSDSVSGETDTDGTYLWRVIGGTRDGQPSQAAFIAAAAQSADRIYYDLSPSAAPRQSVDPADSLKRYFPAHPAGWAYSRKLGGQGSAFQRLVAFFQGSEKKYMSFYNTLWPRKDLDAERLHDMVVFGYNIDEPDEVNRWARRFAIEHPEDPRALRDLVGALHLVELKEPPALSDSIRPWLPVLDTIYQRAGLSADEGYTLVALAKRYGDPGTAARWSQRYAEAKGRRYWLREDSDDPVRRRVAEAAWLKESRASCVRPSGKFSVNRWGLDWKASCQRDRIFGFNSLAHARLLDGDAAAARAFADSALSISMGGGSCGRYFFASETRAMASLALGDTASARRDLIAEQSMLGPNGQAYDSARKWLGRHFDARTFDAAVDSARHVYLLCGQKLRDETKRHDAMRHSME